MNIRHLFRAGASSPASGNQPNGRFPSITLISPRKISRFCYRTFLTGTILAAFTWPALCRADEINILVGDSGSDPFHRTITTSTTAPSLGLSYSGAHGSATTSVAYGSVSLSVHSASDSNNGAYYYTGGVSSGGGAINDYWLETITINNSALTGTAGTAQFTYAFSGSFSSTIPGPDGFTGWGVATMSNFYYNGFGGGNTASISSVPSTLTDNVGFTFGTPFQIKIALAGAGNTVGDTNATVDATMSLRGTGMSVLVGGNLVGFTSTAKTGSAGAVPVTNGASYSGFTLANTTPYGHGSIASILGGTASADSVVEATFLAQVAGFTQASDIVDFKGFGTDKHVLQLSYDPSIATSLFGSEANARLLWLDSVSGLFENAVFGDSDGGATSHAYSGAYNSATESALGSYGVDTVNHVVWAVVDHNSEFSVGQQAPEPGTWALLFGGMGMFAGWSRFGRRSNA